MTLILNFSHELAMGGGIVITVCALSLLLMLVKYCVPGGSFSFSLKLGCLLLYLYVLCAGETHVCCSSLLGLLNTIVNLIILSVFCVLGMFVLNLLT